jgi:alpha-amylase
MDLCKGDQNYFYEELTNAQVQKNAERFYLQMNQHLRGLMLQHKGNFRIAFHLSGVMMDLLEKYRKDVLDSFGKLAWTNGAEFIGGTYYHSLSYFYSKTEFIRQIKLHHAKIRSLFDQEPMVFVHPELYYSDGLAETLREVFSDTGLICDIEPHIFKNRNFNYTYSPFHIRKPSLLIRNPIFTERFGQLFKLNSKYKVTDFIADLRNEVKRDEVVTIYLDYDALYVQMTKEEGSGMHILSEFVAEVLKYPDLYFMTPSMVVARYKPSDSLPKVESPTEEGYPFLNSWLENPLRKEAAWKLYEMEPLIMASNDAELINTWSLLQAQDYFQKIDRESPKPEQIQQFYIAYTQIISALRLQNM